MLIELPIVFLEEPKEKGGEPVESITMSAKDSESIESVDTCSADPKRCFVTCFRTMQKVDMPYKKLLSYLKGCGEKVSLYKNEA